jgi:hypothetical protein
MLEDIAQPSLKRQVRDLLAHFNLRILTHPSTCSP